MNHIDQNLVVANEYYKQDKERHSMCDALFDGEGYSEIDPSIDMYDILVSYGIFKSRSEVRKNWKRSGREIPKGFSHFADIGKLHHSIAIWRPIG